MGHERMARIIGEILSQEPDLEVQIASVGELLGTNLELIAKAWNYLIRHNRIRTADFLMNFFLRIAIVPWIDAFELEHSIRCLEVVNPDLIISTTDGVNRLFGTYASLKGIPFNIAVTDISIFNDLVNPQACHLCYFQETGVAIQSYNFQMTYHSCHLYQTSLFHKLKYVLRIYGDYILYAFKNSIFRSIPAPEGFRNNAKVEVIGALAEKKYFQIFPDKNLLRKLKIPENTPTVLIASGSIGGKFLYDIVKTIYRHYKKPLNLLVMCGRDQETYQRFKSLHLTNSSLNLWPFSYVDNFEEFLRCSDCIIARPSAGIFIESLFSQTPWIAFGQVPSNDKGSLGIIEKYHTGEICRRRQDLVPALDRVLKKNCEYRENIKDFLKTYPATHEEKANQIKRLIRGQLFGAPLPFPANASVQESAASRNFQ